MNSNFIPLYYNFSTSGFPTDLPGFEKYRVDYKKYKTTFGIGLTASAILDPTGNTLLGDSGDLSHLPRSSINYHSDQFLEYLEQTLAKWQAGTSP